jgi:hypothetical protein
MSLAAEIKAELDAGGANYPLTITNDGKTVIIEVPESETTFTARLVMQGFNTTRFRAQRVDRSLRRIEVKYRNVQKA